MIDVTNFLVQHPWTGTKADGTKATANCTNWTVTTGNGECGLTTATDGTWTAEAERPCGVPYSLYCFEQ